MTVAEAIRAAATRLAATSDTARFDAELLMAQALGISRSDMLLRAMGASVPEGFAALIERRAAHEPVAYILGHQEFYGREFRVTPDVLIPRGDSETLIAAALEVAADAALVLDLGTGSGALLVTALLELGAAQGVGTDRSQPALDTAEGNARRLGLGAERAQFRRLDWRAAGWAKELDRFDLILCNPPYVEDAAELAPDVRDHEPAGALFAGPDGLDDYRILIPQLRALMKPGGAAIFEIGFIQGDAITALAQAHGFHAELRHDLANRPRAVVLW
ncbi:peptide chain release factor N(5)-glutamine methyltransferase [Qipengyuania sp. ASV99]|uniref:peptide chain release factor N(5)-glutamine methyltransferase n=1 Tax=Qipengyuania sp. ASV99 TaxID=3399681 RepID=UPI003A4C7C03